MSYSYKTENLELPIWGSNDKPTQDDLNFQNNKIDTEFKEKLNTKQRFLPSSAIQDIHISYDGITKTTPYVLILTEEYYDSKIISLNCGTIINISRVNKTSIYFIPFDWFSGSKNDIKILCLMKENT